MANVIELTPGQSPAESTYIVVQVHPKRTDTMSVSFGTVRHVPDDEEAIAREIMHAQREADEFGHKNVYVRRRFA